MTFAHKFNNILDLFNLSQFVNNSTHRHGNTLDLVISTYPITQINISDPAISDHYFITFHCILTHPKPKRPRITISFRELSSIDFTILNSDLSFLLSSLQTTITPDSLYKSLSSALSTVLDSDAPVIDRYITSRPGTSSFYTNDLLKKKSDINVLANVKNKKLKNKTCLILMNYILII